MKIENGVLRSYSTAGIMVFLSVIFLISSGCSGKLVNKNDKVKVEYIGKLDDGTIFDQSKEGQPLEFVVGAGQMIPGFDKAVEGMKLNEEKTFTITPEEAYGKRDTNFVKEFSRESFPLNTEPVAGMVIGLTSPSGEKRPAKILNVTDKVIIVDLNHPLAGENLIFSIKVVSIESAD